MVKSILIILVQMMINYGSLASFRFYMRRNSQGLRLADKDDDLASYSEREWKSRDRRERDQSDCSQYFCVRFRHHV